MKLPVPIAICAALASLLGSTTACGSADSGSNEDSPPEQEPPGAAVLELSPCTQRCGMTLVPVAEFGEAVGPGMIEGGGEIAVDHSGRLYIGAEDHVVVFDADGTLLRRIGRRGEGPGELMSNRAFAVVDDGTFVILDSGRGVILKFDWTGQLLDEVRPQGWAPIGTGVGLVSMGGARAVYQAAFRGGDREGYPLHLINLESGELEASFGSETGEFDINRERVLEVVHASGPGESIWMARNRAYWIELWEPDNRLILSMRRDVSWFPDALVDGVGHGGPGTEPEPTLFSIAADDLLLWVMIGRADERWAEAEPDDFQMQFDTYIEVIDWQHGRVIASQRFDQILSPMIAPGLVGEVVITPEASVRLRTLRIELEAGRR